MLPIQKFVIESPHGTISDSLVVMTFMLEIDGGMKFFLLLRLKSQLMKGISPYSSYGQFCPVTHVLALSTNCPIISHMCLPCLPSITRYEFFSVFLVSLNETRTLGRSKVNLFVSGVKSRE